MGRARQETISDLTRKYCPTPSIYVTEWFGPGHKAQDRMDLNSTSWTQLRSKYYDNLYGFFHLREQDCKKAILSFQTDNSPPFSGTHRIKLQSAFGP